MKRILIIFAALSCIFLVGCNKNNALNNEPEMGDDTNKDAVESVEDEYYIRYVASYTSKVTPTYVHAVMTTPDGQKSFTMVQKQEEYAYGPVKAGFKMTGATQIYTANATQDKEARMELYVSKNGLPFVMVNNSASTNYISYYCDTEATYTIK